MISAMIRAIGKLSKMYTHVTIFMGLRPRSGRKPIKIVFCVYILDSFPIARIMAEIMVFCILCVFPWFPQFPGL